MLRSLPLARKKKQKLIPTAIRHYKAAETFSYFSFSDGPENKEEQDNNKGEKSSFALGDDPRGVFSS